MSKKVAAVTLGCKVNLHDTQVLLAKFEAEGHVVVDRAEDADICIVNTCCVTNNADKKSRQAVRRAKACGGTVMAVGCACQANPARFEEIGADIVLGTTKDFAADKILDKTRDRTRAFLKIQDGCDNFCTFCIIPHVRGKSRSRPLSDVLAQARRFAEMGHKEIVVAGICVASYGNDLQDCDLLSVLRQICEIQGIRRVRLSSVEPNVITPEFLGFVANEPKFCDHLHLSLQSGCDGVLAAMGRKYTRSQFADAIKALRKVLPNVSITTDVIAGFPGETDEQHQETLDFISKVGLAALHVFPYSAKEGTAAAKMSGQLPAVVKSQRAKELIKLGDKLTAAHYAKFIGCTMPVLVENRNAAGFYEGKTTNYIPVYFEAVDGLEGSIVDVKLDAVYKEGFFGVLQYN